MFYVKTVDRNLRGHEYIFHSKMYNFKDLKFTLGLQLYAWQIQEGGVG